MTLTINDITVEEWKNCGLHRNETVFCARTLDGLTSWVGNTKEAASAGLNWWLNMKERCDKEFEERMHNTFPEREINRYNDE